MRDKARQFFLLYIAKYTAYIGFLLCMVKRGGKVVFRTSPFIILLLWTKYKPSYLKYLYCQKRIMRFWK